MSRPKIAPKESTSNTEMFDFSEMLDSSMNDAAIADVMTSLVETNNNQIRFAVELTKIIVDKTTKEMSEDDVFATFIRACDVIKENFHVNKLLAQLPTV